MKQLILPHVPLEVNWLTKQMEKAKQELENRPTHERVPSLREK